MILKTIVVLLITSTAWAQSPTRDMLSFLSDSVTSDTLNHSPNKDFENRISLSPIDSSGFDFEIRCYKLTTTTNTINLRIVRFENDKWEALEFAENNKSKIQERALVPISGFEMFLSNLIKYNFATLPNQAEVDKKIQDSFASKKDYLQSRPSIMDGYQFTIEFKIGDKFRVYRFENPESYAKYYSNIEEFKNYASIKDIFQQDLERQ